MLATLCNQIHRTHFQMSCHFNTKRKQLTMQRQGWLWVSIDISPSQEDISFLDQKAFVGPWWSYII